jgi:RHS repeat-associated protein
LPSQSTGGAAAGSTTQPIQWSSEFYDSELGLVYYNYRHYNPVDGRWLCRDAIHELGFLNVYRSFNNEYNIDNLGLFCTSGKEHNQISELSSFELIFKHSTNKDLNLSIKNSGATIIEVLNNYALGKAYEAAPIENVIKQSIADAHDKYQNIVGKLKLVGRNVQSNGFYYDKVTFIVKALRCCCEKKGKKHNNPKSCCKPIPIRGSATNGITLDLRGQVASKIVVDGKDKQDRIKKTIETTYHTMKNAINDLKKNKICKSK